MPGTIRTAFTFLAIALLPLSSQAQETAPPQATPSSPATIPSQAPSSPATDVPAAPPSTVTPPAPNVEPAVPAATDSAPSAPAGPGAPADLVAPGAPVATDDPTTRDERLPHDLTPLGMFMAADWVVKAVMIGLAFASLVTWTIWLSKALEIAFAKRRARASVRRLERAETLNGALSDGRGRWRGPVAALAAAAQEERQLSNSLLAEGVKERAAIALSRIEARASRSIGRGTGILATIGSTAPFVGLFGTVWGIMNSFISISESNTTNLAVVAPGIAEALLATGIGLVAAIPAVIIYNVFSRSIAGYRAILADGSAAVMRHLSRDLDRAEALPHAMPAE